MEKVVTKSMFKIGDLVTIKKLNIQDSFCYPRRLNPMMCTKSGRKAKIVKIYHNNNDQDSLYYVEPYYYQIQFLPSGDPSVWDWDTAMFEECIFRKATIF